MKKKFSLLALALASCVTALAGSPLTSQAAEIPQLGPSRIWGTMTKSGNDTIIFDNQSGESYQGGILSSIYQRIPKSWTHRTGSLYPLIAFRMGKRLMLISALP